MSTLQDLLKQSAKVDAISKYLDKIELHFAKTPNVFNRFVDVLDAFKNQSIDKPRAMERVSDLFAAHEGLLEEFHALIQSQTGYKGTYQEAPAIPQEYATVFKERPMPNVCLVVRD
ncbi:MAG: hypothetical protein Q9168_007583 [Polycauliona sp. 1 TL-2023]